MSGSKTWNEQGIGWNCEEEDFPRDWKIHPVVSVVHLERYHHDDPFQRKPEQPGPVHVDGDTEEYQSYEIDKIIAKRTLPVGKNKKKTKTQYLVKWKGYNDEWNTWMPAEQMDNAQELVRQFEGKEFPLTTCIVAGLTFFDSDRLSLHVDLSWTLADCLYEHEVDQGLELDPGSAHLSHPGHLIEGPLYTED